MAFWQRSQKSESLVAAAKSFAKSFAVLVFTLSSLVHCAHSSGTPAAAGSTKGPSVLVKGSSPNLTAASTAILIGENTSPVWAQDSNRLLFISKNRESHKNTQVYELEIATLKERRITYSDGDVATPLYVMDGKKIVYASTTDELKERPLLLQKKGIIAEELQPFEIYLSDLTGLEIERLTNNPGFDGNIQWNPQHPNEVEFTSLKNKFARQLKLNLISKAVLITGSRPHDSQEVTSKDPKIECLRQLAKPADLDVGDGKLSPDQKHVVFVSQSKQGPPQLLLRSIESQQQFDCLK